MQASDLGLIENTPFYGRDSYLQSPISKNKLLKGRESFPLSPFKFIRSPNYMMPKTNEDEYNFDPEYEPLDGQFNNIFEKEDNNLTVGQMFCGADLQSASKKDVLNEYQYDSSPDNEESATKSS